ncbi:MAG: hypothetical protein RR289_08250, partial [Niameybacter sp.]
GNLLRMERIKQDKGQKEICYGICVVSYLCKIEKGQVRADEQIVMKLFANLGITYCNDSQLLEEGRKLIEQYYYQMNYGLPREAFVEVKALGACLGYSELGLDYRLICGLEGEDVYELVKSCKDCMTEEQLGIFYLLTPIESKWEEILEAYEKAHRILGTSYSLLKVFIPLYQLGHYTEIQRRAKICRELAVEEGNTYILAHTFFAQADAYATLDLDELMLEHYERGLRLMQHTHWQGDDEPVYYNMGAVYLTKKDYEKAMMYLNKMTKESFLLYQKKALVCIRSGRLEEVQLYLEGMKTYIEKEDESEAHQLMYEEALMELKEDYLKDPDYLELMEQLIKVLEQEKHFGYIYFYREQITQAYRKQKKYKKAFEFQEEISSKMTMM